MRLGDHQEVAKLVRKAWALGVYRDIEIDDDLLLRTVHGYLADANSCVFVDEVEDGVLAGIIAGSIGRLSIAKARAASDEVFYCETGQGAALINHFVRWAIDKKVRIIGMGVSSGDARAGKLIESQGFEPVGGLYYRVHHE